MTTMKKYNEMNSSEDSFNQEDLSFQAEEDSIKTKINNTDHEYFKANFERYDKIKKKLYNGNQINQFSDFDEKRRSDKRSLWAVFYDKFIKKSIKNGALPIIEDVEYRINTLMNSHTLQGTFSKKAEAQMKNFSAKNQPITDLRRFINQITSVDTSENHKDISPKAKKQSTLFSSNKKLLKKKTLMDLLPNCDITKLLAPVEPTKSPAAKMSSPNMTTNISVNKTDANENSKRKNSILVDSRRSMNLVSHQNLDNPIKVSSTPRKSVVVNGNNNILHNLEVKKNLNDISAINEKPELTEKSKTFGFQERKPEKFKFILNKEERDVLKLISNNKYSYEIEFEGYEHLLKQSNLTKRIVQNMDFKFLENIIILNADKNINEKLYEKSSKLRSFQAKTNNIIERFLKKGDKSKL